MANWNSKNVQTSQHKHVSVHVSSEIMIHARFSNEDTLSRTFPHAILSHLQNKAEFYE